jgi:lysylphosphatidylglycerol synthetase-like protein (DUF2156 family)
MVYETMENVNVTTLDGTLVYVANAVPVFIPALILFVWVTIGLTIYLGSRKLSGQADIFAAFSASGFMTVVLGTILTLVSGLANLWTISLSIAIFIVSVLLLLPRRNRD